MISSATIDAARKVAAYAACRPVALDLSAMPIPPAQHAAADAASSPAARTVATDPAVLTRRPHGGPELQRNSASG